MASVVEDKLVESVLIGAKTVPLAKLPAGYELREDLGLIVHKSIGGQLLHTNQSGGLFETRATKTPGGDYLLMFPDALPGAIVTSTNGHYGGKKVKCNDLVAYRSKDKGKTWSGPTVPCKLEFNQHGFLPLIPKGTKRLYCFGTQPAFDKFNGIENAAIGFRYSDDDGFTWSQTEFIEPKNDPGFQGMSVMRVCETDSGAWLVGAHTGTHWFKREDGTHTVKTRQYVLRSTDQGKTWTVSPGAREDGWFVKEHDRMDEGRPINLGGGRVMIMARTCEGHLWEIRSNDDGATWSAPTPTPLVHPDAPPMLFHLSDGKTLIAFHHNAATGSHFNRGAMVDRAQLWFALSRDEGKTWTAPQFLLANAIAENTGNPWLDYNCSYVDMFSDNGTLHIFMPHRWRRALYLTLKESDLAGIPAKPV